MVFLKSYHHPYLFMMFENRSRHTENLEKVDSCINAKFKITSNLKKVKFHPIWFWRPLLNYSITIMFILEVQVNKTIKFLTISSLNITFHVLLLFCFSLGFQCLLGCLARRILSIDVNVDMNVFNRKYNSYNVLYHAKVSWFVPSSAFRFSNKYKRCIMTLGKCVVSAAGFFETNIPKYSLKWFVL